MRRRFLPSLFFDQPIDNFFNFETDLFKNDSSGISLYEDEKHIYIEAAVPGITPDEIEISLDKGILWIRGESKKEKKDVKYHIKASSSFSYQIPLPERYDDTKQPEAECKEGILTITFSKTEKEKPKKILIKKK